MQRHDEDEQLTFSDIVDDFQKGAELLFGKNRKELAKTAQAAVELCQSALDADANIPLNVFLNADGSKTWELAIPGKTKENVTISQGTKNGQRVITVEVKATELTDEQKKELEGRTPILQKIKGMNGIKFSAFVPAIFDLDNLKAKVENGLLTVTVPKVPEEQPRTFTVE